MAELGLAALPGTWSSAFSISSHSPYDKDFISPKTPRGYILLLTPLHRGGERGSEKDRGLAQSHITRKQRTETQPDLALPQAPFLMAVLTVPETPWLHFTVRGQPQQAPAGSLEVCQAKGLRLWLRIGC